MKSKGCKITTHFYTPSTPHTHHPTPLKDGQVFLLTAWQSETKNRAKQGSLYPHQLHLWPNYTRSRFQKLLGSQLPSCNVPSLHKGKVALRERLTHVQLAKPAWPKKPRNRCLALPDSLCYTQKELISKTKIPHALLRKSRQTPRVITLLPSPDPSYPGTV